MTTMLQPSWPALLPHAVQACAPAAAGFGGTGVPAVRFRADVDAVAAAPPPRGAPV